MPYKIDRRRKAFSLVELLIVILITSLVYFLGFSNIEKSESAPKALTPLNLKSTIVKSNIFQGEGSFICIDKCRSCYLRANINSPFEAYKNRIDLKNIEAYTLDAEDNLQKIEYGRYQDEKICLALHFYRNGSSTQTILKQGEDVYFLPAFFGNAQRVDSLEEAKELWLKNDHLLSNKGDFY